MEAKFNFKNGKKKKTNKIRNQARSNFKNGKNKKQNKESDKIQKKIESVDYYQFPMKKFNEEIKYKIRRCQNLFKDTLQ